MRNMKIEINEAQLLDEVVEELERLGFENCTTFNSKNVKFILAFEDHKTFTDYFNLDCSDIEVVETTLAELKEMQCKI
mgnify:CR=1 FL=1